MKLLITGGAGFIGSTLIRLLLSGSRTEHRIVNLDKLTYAGNPENLAAVQDNPAYSFIEGDICDATLVDTPLRSRAAGRGIVTLTGSWQMGC